MRIGNNTPGYASYAASASVQRSPASNTDTFKTKAGGYDFTHMTRRQLREAVSELKLTLDQSSRLVTIMSPYDYVLQPDGQLNIRPHSDDAHVNFIAHLQDVIKAAKERHATEREVLWSCA